tara:strand:+ start:989 stop:1729 length:741 start_codon:yes stop_codon:yes gene_type:complete
LLNKSLIFCFTFIFLLEVDASENYPNPKDVNFVGVKFNLIKNGNLPFHYIWLHGDEKTAKLALDYHISKYSGKAFFIQNDSREIRFKDTQIDPNRIFSRDGAINALTKFKLDWIPDPLNKALDELDNERHQFLIELMPDSNGILIAVHNNFRGYNINKEIKRSNKVSIKKRQNPRDFILCTNEKDFVLLSNGPYNVVLQNELPHSDDGSLSWESLRRNIRYINIETRLGYLSKQKKMLDFIRETLK